MFSWWSRGLGIVMQATKYHAALLPVAPHETIANNGGRNHRMMAAVHQGSPPPVANFLRGHASILRICGPAVVPPKRQPSPECLLSRQDEPKPKEESVRG